jgi:aryl-alcohol dehydrogenase-like predicted oxidoreductase
MQAGLLTDRFSVERVTRMATDDWRRGAAEFNPSNLDRNIALRDALKPIAQRHRTSVSSVAIAWVLSWPGVTAAIVGARSPEQVDGWIGAGNLELGPAALDEIARNQANRRGFRSIDTELGIRRTQVDRIERQFESLRRLLL